MPDKKLYYEDPDLDVLRTHVAETGELDGSPWVRLDETIFYPEGGGQPADRGTIENVRVMDVQSHGSQILHFVERPISRGPVSIVLDSTRRSDHRQQHTAQHLLSALLADQHGMPTTSFHLGESYTAIEVAGSVGTQVWLRRLEADLNGRIRQDLPVRTRWVDPSEMDVLKVRTRGLPEGHSGLVRIVEIEGIDLNTCGGTHVDRLGEIQMIHLVDAEAARGGTRIRFLAGDRVLRALDRSEGLESDLKARIGTAPEEFANVVDGWQSERKRLERRVRDLEAKLAELTAAALAAEPGPRIKRFIPGGGPDHLRALASAVLKRRPECVVVLVGELGEPCETCFIVQSGPRGPEDVADLGERLRELLGARGGGKGRVFQGRGGRFTSGASALDAL